eukprot:gene3250-6431_t
MEVDPIDENAVTELLNSNQGIEMLVNGGSIFGLTSKTESFNHIVDFGSVSPESLQIENSAPLGYDGFESSPIIRTLQKTITISNINSLLHGMDSYKLLSYKCFLNENIDVATISLEDEQGNDIVGMSIKSGVSVDVYVKISMVSDSFQGFFGKWIVFCWEGRIPCSPVATAINRFLLGMRATICITSPDANKNLSSEARSFLPKARLTYFDSECFHIPLSESKHPCICPPPGFLLARKFALPHKPIWKTLQDEYMKSIQTGTLDAFIKDYNLRYDPKNVHANEHLKRLGRMLWVEQAQMIQDIKYFDVFPVQGEFRMRNNPATTPTPPTFAGRSHRDRNYSSQMTMTMSMSSPLTMTCSVRIRGCSENRPKISIGDVIKLRPLEESLHAVGFTYGVNKRPLPLFELEGGVFHVQLASEVVTLEIPVPIYLMDHIDYNHRGDMQFIVKVCSSLNFQSRCNFRTDGLQFAHDAVQVALNAPFLQESLFPSGSGLSYSNNTESSGGHTASNNNTDSFSDSNSNTSISYDPCMTDDSADDLNLDPVLNDEQRCAVRTALSLVGTSMSRRQEKTISDGSISMYLQGFNHPPFIIYGPPGTGKTITVAHTIRALLLRYPDISILACAPSDAAADVLLSRLVGDFSPSDMFRLNWWQRSVASAHPSIHKYCEIKDTLFDLPLALDQRIIISTCGASGALRGSKRSNGQHLLFDVVIVDEACQATESEVLVPLSFCRPEGIIILAGDPQQLGPSPRSPVYKLANYVSLMERLLHTSVYKEILPENDVKNNQEESTNTSTTSTSTVVKSRYGVLLCKNYRSHSEILRVPSELFYAGHLEECGVREELDALLSWPGLGVFPDGAERRPQFPIVFVGTAGSHFHEIDSPSFSNNDEVEKVCEVCANLTSGPDSARLGVKMGDIGVIAAFRSQVLAIRMMLRSRNMGAINVGEVEDFQGQEVRIAVVSTVLSSRVPNMEVHGALGLIGEHKRFNVSVTRGKALLVVVGNPKLLLTDNNWKTLLQHCWTHGSYQGVRCDELIASMEKPSESGDVIDESADDDLLNTVTRVAMLGSASSTLQFPTSLEQYYRRDIEWRVML